MEALNTSESVVSRGRIFLPQGLAQAQHVREFSCRCSINAWNGSYNMYACIPDNINVMATHHKGKTIGIIRRQTSKVDVR